VLLLVARLSFIFPSHMLTFAMQRIQHVVFKLDTKIGLFAVGKLHTSYFALFTIRSKGKL